MDYTADLLLHGMSYLVNIPRADKPIWQILASTGKWDAAQKEDSGRTAGSPICDVTEVTEKRRKEEP